MATFNIGLIGFGTVGAGVWRNTLSQASLLRQRSGREIVVSKVASRNLDRARQAGVPEACLAAHWREVVSDPDVQVVVELIGGISEARELILAALRAGKHVVTANKALLAHYGDELFAVAASCQRRILFEASVAGGIPLIKSVREGLAANRILSLHGIINGTCNYMLTQMSTRGLQYAEVLEEAKRLGYAEADESLDVDGHDTAHKACVLARIAYGFWPDLQAVSTEGIAGLDRRDIQFAQLLGYEVKLLAVIKGDNPVKVEVRVHPTLLPRNHVLASVSGVFNGVMIRGDVVGDTLFYGRGAGADPTSSSVISDLMELAQALKTCDSGCWSRSSGEIGLKPMAEVISRYYLRLMVEDRPGVLAEVATVLGRRKIGISSVVQPEGHEGDLVPLIIMVHDALEQEFAEARREIESLAAVRAPSVCLRVEDFA